MNAEYHTFPSVTVVKIFQQIRVASSTTIHIASCQLSRTERDSALCPWQVL